MGEEKIVGCAELDEPDLLDKICVTLVLVEVDEM